jgi:hypothetical protein
VCKCVLPPGDNPIAVNKCIKLYCCLVEGPDDGLISPKRVAHASEREYKLFGMMTYIFTSLINLLSPEFYI